MKLPFTQYEDEGESKRSNMAKELSNAEKKSLKSTRAPMPKAGQGKKGSVRRKVSVSKKKTTVKKNLFRSESERCSLSKSSMKSRKKIPAANKKGVSLLKSRHIVNKETSTSSSCPLPQSILNSIPHVIMRTISDAEAKKSKAKVKGSPEKMTRKAEVGENTGRWTKEEHEMFLLGLEQFGKEWKDISQLIPTRSVVQIRTHAQKYFQKVAKSHQKEGVLDDATLGSICSTASAVLPDGTRKTKRKRIKKQKGKITKKEDTSGTVAKKPRKRSSPKRTKKIDYKPIPSSLFIKAPAVSQSAHLAAAFSVDFVDDTPRSVAHLFNAGDRIEKSTSSEPDLTFFDEDIQNFDFDSASDASTEDYIPSGSTSPFMSEEYPELKTALGNAAKVNFNALSGNMSSDTFMAFSDLDYMDRQDFVADLEIPQKTMGILKTAGLFSSPREEEDFISGLLA